jgi:hypothetical protein
MGKFKEFIKSLFTLVAISCCYLNIMNEHVKAVQRWTEWVYLVGTVIIDADKHKLIII